MTIKEFLEEVQRAFEKAGIECANREALLLCMHILSCDNVYIFTHQNEYIDEKILLASAALIKERIDRRPLCYILGTSEFYGYSLTVDERVLIPRPETECMVEDIISEYRGKAPFILDLCTGSGCISLALAKEISSSNILATDISLKALQIATHNLSSLNNVKIRRSDLFEKIDESFDLIVSNPPYVAEKYKEKMQKEVRDFEPSLALFAGEDGLDIIDRIIPSIDSHLNKAGLLYMEMSEEQCPVVLEKLKDLGIFETLEIKKDLAGHDRYVKAKKKC